MGVLTGGCFGLKWRLAPDMGALPCQYPKTSGSLIDLLPTGSTQHRLCRMRRAPHPGRLFWPQVETCSRHGALPCQCPTTLGSLIALLPTGSTQHWSSYGSVVVQTGLLERAPPVFSLARLQQEHLTEQLGVNPSAVAGSVLPVGQ